MADIKENEEDPEVEYVSEPLPQDELFQDFAHIFEKFSHPKSTTSVTATATTTATTTATNQTDKKPEQSNDDKSLALVESNKNDDTNQSLQPSGEDVSENQKISKRRLKQSTRMTVAELKQKVGRPELVELHDVTASDPSFLLNLKSTKNSVPVPRHWNSKRRYLQGKRGYEKPPFQLPDFIRQTGIMEMRDSIQDKESGKSLKAKTRERVQPKMGKIQMDYQQLHDAFFKWQTKPRLTIHGDLYYEGKEFEQKFKKKPGELSNELRRALGMPTGPNCKRYPPPWLTAMKRHGPPPSYPYLQIPGLNCPFPDDDDDNQGDMYETATNASDGEF